MFAASSEGDNGSRSGMFEDPIGEDSGGSFFEDPIGDNSGGSLFDPIGDNSGISVLATLFFKGDA